MILILLNFNIVQLSVIDQYLWDDYIDGWIDESALVDACIIPTPVWVCINANEVTSNDS